MLYTRKGDKGTTKVFDSKPGERISKSSCRTDSLGALDELNSFLGLAKVLSKDVDWKIDGITSAEILHSVQSDLFIVQAELAGTDKTITQDKVTRLETLVDKIESELPPIKTFFIPGGTEMGAMFDVARTLARKAERRVVAALEQETKVSDATLSYLNRLSSLLYALARLTNHKSGINEEPPSYK